MSAVVSSFSLPPHIFQYCIGFLEVADICLCTRVCKLWNQSISDQNFWKQLFDREGIPLVMSANGKPRDYREDFKTLYPITLSGKLISRLFGKMIGKVPPISEEWFLKLQEEDPFEKGKRIKETFVFVVEPHRIARTVNQETPLILDLSGNLLELRHLSTATETISPEQPELIIPFSLKNLKVLCAYPVEGKKNLPIFSKYFFPEIFTQCNTTPHAVNVHFLRRHIAKESRGRIFPHQEELVKARGFEITPLRIRVLFDAIMILKTGTCPDDDYPLTYARSPDVFHYNHIVTQAVVGCFSSPPCFFQTHKAPGLAAFGNSAARDDIGVAPCVPNIQDLEVLK